MMMEPPAYLSPAGAEIWRDIVCTRPWLDATDYFCVECATLLMLAGSGDAAAVLAELGWRPKVRVR